MDLSAVGYFVWGVACLVEFTALLFLCGGLQHCGFLAASFLWYLWWQIVSSVLWLRIHSEEQQASSWLEWAFWQVLLIAGCGYGSIGIAVVAAVFAKEEKVFSTVRRMLFLGLIIFVAASIVLVALQLGEKPVLAIVVFSCYFPAASLALVGVVCVWWLEWPIHQSHERNTRTMKRISLIASLVGIVDYLLPAFEELGLPLWEATFVTRVLDSVVYVPGIIPWLIWMDKQPPLASLSFQDLLNPRFHLASTSDHKTHPL